MSHAHADTTDAPAYENLPTKTGLNRGSPEWVNAHIDMVLTVPEPGQEWRSYDIIEHPEQFESVAIDLPSRFQYRVRKMADVGAVKRLRLYKEELRSYVYETNEQVYRYAERVQRDRDTLPCGHGSGFETIEAGERYACGFEYCDAEYSRETIEAVYR